MKNETKHDSVLKRFSAADKLFEGQGSLIVCFPRRKPWAYATDLHHNLVNNSKISAQCKCSASIQ